MPWEEGVADLSELVVESRQTQWFDRAACAAYYKKTGIDLWFKDDSDSNGRQLASEVRAAKAICKQCPVREKCLQDADIYGWEYGIWGGLDSTERRRRRVKSQAAA